MNEDLVAYLVEMQGECPSYYRRGQWASNRLHEIRPDLTNNGVTGSHFDPFYVDANLPAFFVWVINNW